MLSRVLTIAVCAAGVLYPGEKKSIPTVSQSNEAIAIKATIIADKEGVQEALGTVPGVNLILVQVRVSPKGEKPMWVRLDDFTLLSHKDGQKTQPFAPTQIAGGDAIVVSSRDMGGGVMGGSNGPVFGIPGLGGIGGRPRQLPGDGGGIGSAGGQTGVQATGEGDKDKDKDKGKPKDNPVLAVLKEKVLPETETIEPVSGLLYFPIEGKHKLKDLELIYRGPAGKLNFEFR